MIYQMLSFALAVLWWLHRRERVSFPWLPDLLVTVTCFTDIPGNRMNLYDTVVWFDDWMHVMNNGLLAAAALLLTMDRSASLGRVVERSLAYADTLGDLGLETLGAVAAAGVVHQLWCRGALAGVEPLVSPRRTAPVR